MPDYKQRFENGEYPGCFLPYPPFYGICINGIKHINKVTQNDNEVRAYRKCVRCIQQLKLCGYERLGYSEDAESSGDILEDWFIENRPILRRGREEDGRPS